MRVESNSLLQLQALQARAAFQQVQPKAPPPPRAEQRPIAEPTGLPTPKLDLADIERVARRAGFVGVEPSAVQRAYNLGESLFADYRV
jgi:hypothetical protein